MDFDKFIIQEKERKNTLDKSHGKSDFSSNLSKYDDKSVAISKYDDKSANISKSDLTANISMDLTYLNRKKEMNNDLDQINEEMKFYELFLNA